MNSYRFGVQPEPGNSFSFISRAQPNQQISFGIKTTSNFCKVTWWDGLIQIIPAIAGVIDVYRLIPAGQTSQNKYILIESCDSNGTSNGKIFFVAGGGRVKSIDLNNVKNDLEILALVADDYYTSLNISDMPKLYYIQLGNNFQNYNVTLNNLPLLTTFEEFGFTLTNLSVTNTPLLTNIGFSTFNTDYQNIILSNTGFNPNSVDNTLIFFSDITLNPVFNVTFNSGGVGRTSASDSAFNNLVNNCGWNIIL
jgi:hypothetical protein